MFSPVKAVVVLLLLNDCSCTLRGPVPVALIVPAELIVPPALAMNVTGVAPEDVIFDKEMLAALPPLVESKESVAALAELLANVSPTDCVMVPVATKLTLVPALMAVWMSVALILEVAA